VTSVEPRLLTAVHEAGHAVVAEMHGLRVNYIILHNFVTGETDISDGDVQPRPYDAFARVAVAGFAAVGVCVGPEAEEQSKATDLHYEEGSDLLVAIENAVAMGVQGDGVQTYLDRIDAEVRSLLGEPVARAAVQLIAEALWGPADRMSGDEVRDAIGEARRQVEAARLS
jgi:hypothetical protein